jgi:hypothetical protein
MIDEDRIFHLEVAAGLRPPEFVQTKAHPADAYGMATVYFNSFMSALSNKPRCSVCNRFHEEYDD